MLDVPTLSAPRGDHFLSHGRIIWYLMLIVWYLKALSCGWLQSPFAILIWLVVWNIFYFPFIGKNNPNWLIFFRGLKPPARMWLAHIFLGFSLIHPIFFDKVLRWTQFALPGRFPIPRTDNFIQHNGNSGQDGNGSALRRNSSQLRKVIESCLVAESEQRNHDDHDASEIVRVIRQNKSK